MNSRNTLGNGMYDYESRVSAQNSSQSLISPCTFIPWEVFGNSRGWEVRRTLLELNCCLTCTGSLTLSYLIPSPGNPPESQPVPFYFLTQLSVFLQWAKATERNTPYT
ncbi:hypothetical protein RRG08_048066 [Elysia crispata]|uniref:Uncharacterized protein n=1 Tax=Elysia crispata TaxID=231223 RepID=A0AAE1D900_9GAST|nr:hypothetical protein RRG08_048066 [Elysia crispata]